MLSFPPATSTCTSLMSTIFRLALDIAQTPARQIAYIENTPMFVADRRGFWEFAALFTRTTGLRGRN